MEWLRNLGLHLSLLSFASSLAAQSSQSMNADPNEVDFSKARQFIQSNQCH
jgi:hypothetical protein